jgi:hypothetical protein
MKAVRDVGSRAVAGAAMKSVIHAMNVATNLVVSEVLVVP